MLPAPLRFLQWLFWTQGRVIIFLLLIIFGFAATLYFKRSDIQEYLQVYQDRNRLRAEVDRLQEEITRLENEREVLGRGGFEVEKVARERFRLSKPGEIVVYLERPDSDDSATTRSQVRRRVPPSIAVPNLTAEPAPDDELQP